MIEVKRITVEEHKQFLEKLRTEPGYLPVTRVLVENVLKQIRELDPEGCKDLT